MSDDDNKRAWQEVFAAGEADRARTELFWAEALGLCREPTPEERTALQAYFARRYGVVVG